MRRPAELVDYVDPVDAETRVGEDAGIAGKGDGVARHHGDRRYGRAAGLGRLRFGPRAGRINDKGVEAAEVDRKEAGGGRDRGIRL